MLKKFILLGSLVFCLNAQAGNGSAHKSGCDIDSMSNSGKVQFDTKNCNNYANAILLAISSADNQTKGTWLWEVVHATSGWNKQYQFRGLRNGKYRVTMYVYQNGKSFPVKGDEDTYTITNRSRSFGSSN